jgi:hypothetical protein
MLSCPVELVPSEVAKDQPVALELMSVEEAAVTVPPVASKPIGAISPVAVVEKTTLTQRTTAEVTDEPVKV